jgi:hypothetical protein
LLRRCWACCLDKTRSWWGVVRSGMAHLIRTYTQSKANKMSLQRETSPNRNCCRLHYQTSVAYLNQWLPPFFLSLFLFWIFLPFSTATVTYLPNRLYSLWTLTKAILLFDKINCLKQMVTVCTNCFNNLWLDSEYTLCVLALYDPRINSDYFLKEQ